MRSKNFTHHYHANALGMAGVLKHPDGTTTIIPSLASAVLATTGGEGFAEVLNYDQGGVSFSNMRSSVLGYDSDYRTFTTRSDVYITNLNLFGRVKAAILQASVTSTREVIDTAPFNVKSDPDNARFSVQSLIRGLTVDGVEVDPELDLDLCDCPTYGEFTDRIGGKRVGAYAKQFGLPKEELEKAVKEKKKPIRGSFVRALRHQPTDKFEPGDGFKLHVKNFGTIYFGELAVEPGTRHLNLLRIEFDSPLAFGDRVPEESGTARPRPSHAAAAAPRPRNGTAAPYDGGSMTLVRDDSNGVPSWP